MNSRQRTILTWWSGVVVFLGAFLLFQVQPIITRRILPWFGGTPTVWTTCMLFFQAVLVFGYAYAHELSKQAGWKARGWVHSAVVLGSLVALPILPTQDWASTAHPLVSIMQLLFVFVGFPYFILSSTGPLIQVWHARLHQDKSPYRLYALSNAASLLALLSYPFIVEPLLGVSEQCRLWTILYACYAVLFVGLGIFMNIAAPPASAPEKRKKSNKKQDNTSDTIPLRRRLQWLLLPALGTVILLAVTNHVSQDMSVTPVLWVVPLSLYLLSYILVFDRPLWYQRLYYAIGAMVLATCCACLLRLVYVDVLSEIIAGRRIEDLESRPSDSLRSYFVEFSIHMVFLFVGCMLCHGETARSKPESGKLTVFYLHLAIGGALGGLFVSILAPLLFSSYVELPLSFAAIFALALYVIVNEGKVRSWWTRRLPKYQLLVTSVVSGAFILLATHDTLQVESVYATRSFFGALQVELVNQHRPNEHLALIHGRIIHGFQWTAARLRNQSTRYYDKQSGIGLLFEEYPRDREMRVGVVGLGVGTLAAYGKLGDRFTFYELNPDVCDVARKYFRFLQDARASTEVIQGDARVEMERQAPAEFDILVLDAFNSDSVPVHLLTKEAVEVYLKHVGDRGIIAAHVTNRHLDLAAVFARIADELSLQAFRLARSEEENAKAEWIVLVRDDAVLEAANLSEHVTVLTVKDAPLWTDDYSNVLKILK